MLLLETRLLLLWCLAIFGWVAHGGTDVAARPRAPQPLEAQPAPVRRTDSTPQRRSVMCASRAPRGPVTFDDPASVPVHDMPVRR